MLTFPSKYGNSRESLHKISSLTNRNIIHFLFWKQNISFSARQSIKSYENKQKDYLILFRSIFCPRNFLDQKTRRRFSSWSLQMLLRCCECWGCIGGSRPWVWSRTPIYTRFMNPEWGWPGPDIQLPRKHTDRYPDPDLILEKKKNHL